MIYSIYVDLRKSTEPELQLHSVAAPATQNDAALCGNGSAWFSNTDFDFTLKLLNMNFRVLAQIYKEKIKPN
jgi:hypothetical protein